MGGGGGGGRQRTTGVMAVIAGRHAGSPPKPAACGNQPRGSGFAGSGGTVVCTGGSVPWAARGMRVNKVGAGGSHAWVKV